MREPFPEPVLVGRIAGGATLSPPSGPPASRQDGLSSVGGSCDADADIPSCETGPTGRARWVAAELAGIVRGWRDSRRRRASPTTIDEHE